MYTYLLLILFEGKEPTAHINRTRDMKQCEYVAENLKEDVDIAGIQATVECRSSDIKYKTGTEIPLSTFR